MNASQVFQHIDKIAQTPGKNDKLALMKEGMKHELFERVVVMAYNPFVTFGLAKLSPYVGAGTSTLDGQDAWTILADLASRKLSGDNARLTVDGWLRTLDAESSDLFRRIILKDMRAGFTEGTINKAKPKSIPEFPYMRCSLPAKSNIDKWDWSPGQISQEKADGMFTNVDVDIAGQASLRTRQGQPLVREQFEALFIEVERTLLPGSQSHGEMLVFRGGVLLLREDNNGYINKLNQGAGLQPNEEVRLYLWDQISLEAVQLGIDKTPYSRRLISLVLQVRDGNSSLVRTVDSRIVKSRAEAMAHFRELLALGKEGTVPKNRDMIWKDGTSKDQVKLKLAAVVDLQVRAIVPGRADTKNAGRPGSLSCGTSCGLLEVDVAVKNEDMRDDVETNPERWVGSIIKVVFNTIMTPDGKPASLFLPRMEEASYRIDKTVPDSFARVREQYQAAMETV